MEVKKLYEKLTGSSEFKAWKKKNPKAYLVHFFKMEEENRGGWQIGYYDREKDRITTFLVGEQIGIIPEQEVFKKTMAIKRLVITKVEIDAEKALGSIKRLQEREYSAEKPIKTVMILQNIGRAQVWNITYITKSFNTLNVKIDASSGRVIQHKLSSLVKFDAG